VAAEHSALARSRQAVLPGLAAGVVVLAVGAWADRGLQGLIVADLRAEQLRTLGGYAAALERQLAKHALLTTALTGWQRSRGNASSPEELEAFARPLLNANPSVRSFNTVEGTVITGVFPLQNNQPALGLDLARHPNPGPVAALNRAIANDSIALMGPIELAQTGSGLLLFQSTHTERNGKPVVAEVVVDVPVLLEEVAISDLQAWSRVSLTSESGAVLFGEASLTDPVQVSVVVPESTWTLSAMPVGGWLAGTDSVLWAYRGGLVAVAVLVGLLVFRVQREGDHLRLAVDTATAKLHEANAELQAAQRFQDAAMAAGSVRLWAYDVDTGVMKRVGVNPHLTTFPANETLDSYLHRVHPED
jgi:sensor domain CHASE-containing protein